MRAIEERDILHEASVRATQEQYARDMANLREELVEARKRYLVSVDFLLYRLLRRGIFTSSLSNCSDIFVRRFIGHSCSSSPSCSIV
jgi:hypothetical protein